MKSCSIDSETCGFQCTEYDGTVAQDIKIKKGSNMWDARRKLNEEGIWCDSCKEHGNKIESKDHDVVTVGLGGKPFDETNMRKQITEEICVYNTCVESGRCKGVKI